MKIFNKGIVEYGYPSGKNKIAHDVDLEAPYAVLAGLAKQFVDGLEKNEKTKKYADSVKNVYVCQRWVCVSFLKGTPVAYKSKIRTLMIKTGLMFKDKSYKWSHRAYKNGNYLAYGPWSVNFMGWGTGKGQGAKIQIK